MTLLSCFVFVLLTGPRGTSKGQSVELGADARQQIPVGGPTEKSFAAEKGGEEGKTERIAQKGETRKSQSIAQKGEKNGA